MVGGGVNPTVGGCVDAPASLSLAQMNIDLGVIGACAVSRAIGVSAYDLSDAAFKRALLAASQKTLVLVTNEKLAARRAPSHRELEGHRHDGRRARRPAPARSTKWPRPVAMS